MSLKQGLEERVRGLALSGCEIILVKEQYVMDMLVKMKIPGIERRLGVMHVRDFDDIQTLNAKQLNAAGWYKRETQSETKEEGTPETQNGSTRSHGVETNPDAAEKSEEDQREKDEVRIA